MSRFGGIGGNELSGTLETDVPVFNVPFRAPGVYHLQLFVEDAVLLERPIVLQTPPQQSAEEDG